MQGFRATGLRGPAAFAMTTPEIRVPGGHTRESGLLADEGYPDPPASHPLGAQVPPGGHVGDAQPAGNLGG